MDTTVVEDSIKEDSKNVVTEEKGDQKDVVSGTSNQNEVNTSETINVSTTSAASNSEQLRDLQEEVADDSFSKEKLSCDEANESSETQPAPMNASTDERRKSHRRKRGRRKKWKPYHMLNKDETDQLEEYENERTAKKHQESFANGRPVAPYNTTQYIMSRHSPNASGLDIDMQPGGYVVFHSSDSPIYNINPDYEQYNERDFHQDYSDVYLDRLEKMTRAQLVQEHDCLVKTQAQLEQDLSDLRNQNSEHIKKLDGVTVEQKLDRERKRYEKLLRMKAKLTGSTEDIVLPWEEQFHVSDDDFYNESNLAA